MNKQEPNKEQKRFEGGNQKPGAGGQKPGTQDDKANTANKDGQDRSSEDDQSDRRSGNRSN